MGQDHIRFVLMVAFFFSTCLIASSGSEMEIIRFSGTYTLTHSERVVQVTESITGSERVEKVTKVASLAPKQERRRRRGYRSRRRRTTKEFKMRQESNSCEEEIEKKQQTFIPVASTMTQGTTTDQQDLCWSHAHSHRDSSIGGGGQCSSNNHESSQEFTATYSDLGSTTSSTFLVCQKLSFIQLDISEWTIQGKKGRSEDVVEEDSKEEHQQQHRHSHERQNIPLRHDDVDHDRPYKPIFFVYPPQRSARLGREKKVGNDDDDGMDYYQPTFHLELDFPSTRSSKDSDRDSTFSEYDPRIRGGFDSYGEDVSFYFSSSSSESSNTDFGNKDEIVSETGNEKGSSSLANASSYFDELCKALLLEYG